MTPTPTQLMQEAPSTVAFYLRKAKEEIDDLFGFAYAKQHPELVAAFLLACTRDFDSMRKGLE